MELVYILLSEGIWVAFFTLPPDSTLLDAGAFSPVLMALGVDDPELLVDAETLDGDRRPVDLAGDDSFD